MNVEKTTKSPPVLPILPPAPTSCSCSLPCPVLSLPVAVLHPLIPRMGILATTATHLLHAEWWVQCRTSPVSYSNFTHCLSHYPPLLSQHFRQQKSPRTEPDIIHPPPTPIPLAKQAPPSSHYPPFSALEGPKTRKGFRALASWLVNSVIGGAAREEWENVTAGI